MAGVGDLIGRYSARGRARFHLAFPLRVRAAAPGRCVFGSAPPSTEERGPERAWGHRPREVTEHVEMIGVTGPRDAAPDLREHRDHAVVGASAGHLAERAEEHGVDRSS
jgi:hypothetical protein